jgi:hypothetical protein
VRYVLDGSTKSQNETDLKKLLDLPSITQQQALAGSEYLDLWKSDSSTQDAYREAAAQKWPETTVFQKE